MAKRIKKVFSQVEPVVKLWAKQAQDSAAYVYYSHSGGRFSYVPAGTPRDRVSAVYFEGRSIFSYGRHYLLGRLVEFNGRKIAAVNFSKYSNTTTSHSYCAASGAKRAGLLVVNFSAPLEAHATDSEIVAAVEAALVAENSLIYSQLEALAHANSSTYWIGLVRKSVRDFNKQAKALGLSKRLGIQVPKEYFEYCRKIAKARELARQDRETRRQAIFDYSALARGEKLDGLVTTRPYWNDRKMIDRNTA